jgi:peroxiredoxin
MSEARRTLQAEALLGKKAPKIILPDQEKEDVDVASLRGKRVLLSFHPLAWTRVCALQMQALEAHAEEFEKWNAVAFGVSVDPSPSKKAWAESLGITKTRLLSDFWPHGAVAQALDIFHDKEGFSDRAAVILDEEGVIRFAKVYAIPELPDIDEQIGFLQNLVLREP